MVDGVEGVNVGGYNVDGPEAFSILEAFALYENTNEDTISSLK